MDASIAESLLRKAEDTRAGRRGPNSAVAVGFAAWVESASVSTRVAYALAAAQPESPSA